MFRGTGRIAKQETKRTPIIRTWMELIHCVFINRTNRREAIQVISQGIENLKNGHSMVIFPEGTRSRGTNVNEFKPVSFRLATKSKVPITPVAINGNYKVLEEHNRSIRPAHISLEICDAIQLSEYENKTNNELVKDLQEIIEKAISRSMDQAS